MSFACATTIRELWFSAPAPLGTYVSVLENRLPIVFVTAFDVFGVSLTGWYG